MSTPIPLTAIIEAREALKLATAVLCHHQQHNELAMRCAGATGALSFYIRVNSPLVPVTVPEVDHG